ncbi:hypothetical protein ACO0R3_004258 [Hanseniaspora guilliermondii]
MNLLSRKFKELIYSINTDDHYSEYDDDEVVINKKFKLKEFNLTKRTNPTDISIENLSKRADSSITSLPNVNNTNATGTDELNFSDDELNFHHNPNTFYANHDLEYSGDNINLSHLNDNKYRNSSNDIDDEDQDNEVNNIYTHSNSSQVPYEEAIDDGSKEVIAAWEYIRNWCMENCNDLYASFNDPCSYQDLNDVEKDMNVTLPKPFKVSSRIHDGQELDGLSGVQGLFFGLTLMTLDEIVFMREHWAKIHRNLYSSNQRLKKLPIQGSIPPGFIKLQYCNPMWIPVVTDNAGNHIAIDLDPGIKGTVGQIIIFGRDFDTKFVIAENWGEFMASFVNDLKLGNWDLDEDADNDYLKGDGELIFVDSVNGSRVYEEYLNVLKRRTWSVWKKQRDIETLQRNKPKFSKKFDNQQGMHAPKVSSGLNSEVERRVGSVRDFSISVKPDSRPTSSSSVDSSKNQTSEFMTEQYQYDGNKETVEGAPVHSEAQKDALEVEEEADGETKDESIIDKATDDEVSKEDSADEQPVDNEVPKEDAVDEQPVYNEVPKEDAAEEQHVEDEVPKEDAAEEAPKDVIENADAAEEAPKDVIENADAVDTAQKETAENTVKDEPLDKKQTEDLGQADIEQESNEDSKQELTEESNVEINDDKPSHLEVNSNQNELEDIPL